MVDLFLAPASRKNNPKPYRHLQKSVVDGIARSEYENYTQRELGDYAKIWGAVDGSKGTWDKLEPGDWVLFYVGYNEYEYASQVRSTENNPTLSRYLWNDHFAGSLGSDDPGDPWNYLIYLENLSKVDISSGNLHDALGYSNPYPVRLQRVKPSRLKSIQTEFGSVDNYIESKMV